MKKTGWKITIRWVKAHACTRDNEMVDTLAKKGTKNRTTRECYKNFLMSVILSQLEKESLRK
jgi:ribonuclease HI